jgi:hypothetical protein
MSEHEGTRASDREGEAFKRAPLGPRIYPWVAMAAVVAGSLGAFGGYAKAQGAQTQVIENIAGKVSEHEDKLKQLPTANERLARIEERQLAQAQTLADIKAAVLPRNPNERETLVTRDTRKISP